MSHRVRSFERVLGVAFVCAGLAALAPVRARAWCQMTSSSARPSATEPCVGLAMHPEAHLLSWTRRCTSLSFSSVLGVSATEGRIDDAMLRAAVGRSIGTWTAVDCAPDTTGLEVTILAEESACSHAAHYRGGRNVNSIVFVATGWSTERLHDPRALAVTYVWHDPATGEILDVDMELNEETKDFHVCALPGCADVVPLDSAVVDLENTLTHEMGHFFGIAHSPDDSEATMFAEAAPGETIKRDLNADDMLGICSIYPPGSLPTACDSTPTGGLGLDCVPPSGCGCAVPGVGHRARAAVVMTVMTASVLFVLASRRRRSRAT